MAAYIYFLLDSRRYGESAKSLGRMILQDLKAVSSEIDGSQHSESRGLYNIVVDEFSDLAGPEFLEFLDRARSSGLGTIVAHQEFSDLKKVSPEYATRLLNLTFTVLAFITKIPESAELISGTAGTTKTWKETEKSTRGPLGFDLRTGDKSLREVEEFLVHPNTLKNLGVGECVVIGKYPKSFHGVLKIQPPLLPYYKTNEFDKVLEELSQRQKSIRHPSSSYSNSNLKSNSSSHSAYETAFDGSSNILKKQNSRNNKLEENGNPYKGVKIRSSYRSKAKTDPDEKKRELDDW